MKLKPLLSKALLISALGMLPTQLHGFGLVWVITDPARDMNWELKTIKKYLILAEKRLAHIDKMLAEKMYSEMKVLYKESHKSAYIRALTSSVSITQNLAAENRYNPIDSGLVCSVIALNNNGISCESSMQRKRSAMHKLQERFLDSQTADATFIQQLAKSHSFSRATNERVQISTVAKAITRYADVVNQYELINESEYSELEGMTDLIFDWGETLPTPDAILSHPTNIDVSEYTGYFQSNMAKGYVNKALMDRTQSGSIYARDSAVIESGSNETLNKLSLDLANAEMTEDAWRIIALTKARRLKQEFKTLEIALRENSSAALKLKQLQTGIGSEK
ncbi:hypothetical protein M2G93_16690 [Vibrio vulnificus]|uniref:hypothetical protein n=1 Tax=Vibrio vulnificus TaxID=672 RepID=UPI0021DADA99|nr:hypothetical protein [Vibrio vulnificus]EHD1698139.1 hypothetical protein [Vibrio vulnificus]EKZ9225868.1 hypothetical protein [Vibrio vulnificus]ELC9582710.1 hypothetical protein [Vibrio vulnificus]MCU8149753.1 hypothetical protein [Vibrio vulnificus]